MTEAVRVIALCMGAALFSVSLRMHRPELAALFSLAVGVVALWMLREPFAEIVAAVRQLAESSMDGGQTAAVVLRAAGITVLSELGVQVCCDSGESAMAGRIRLAARVILVGMALPVAGEIFESISSLLSLF